MSLATDAPVALVLRPVFLHDVAGEMAWNDLPPGVRRAMQTDLGSAAFRHFVSCTISSTSAAYRNSPTHYVDVRLSETSVRSMDRVELSGHLRVERAGKGVDVGPLVGRKPTVEELRSDVLTSEALASAVRFAVGTIGSAPFALYGDDRCLGSVNGDDMSDGYYCGFEVEGFGVGTQEACKTSGVTGFPPA
jgi:hypothetical protein